MKSDSEIRRFVSNLETAEQFFLLLDLLMRHFNAFSTVVTEGDITGTFETVHDREPTDEELDMVFRLCEASLEDRMTQHAMETVYDICLSIPRTEESV